MVEITGTARPVRISKPPAAPPAPGEARKSLAHHSLFGLFAVVVLFGGLALWAATAQIAGAVVASGLIVVEGGSKRVQHQEGGIVKEILVKNEDLVTAGELLLRLDGTAIAANRDIIVSQLSEAFARQARLLAESANASGMERQALLKDWPKPDELDVLFKAQDRLRLARAATRQGQNARLTEQISQLELQIEGLEAQRRATAEQVELLAAEGKDVAALFKKGLVQISRVNELKREESRLAGEEGRLIAEIAQARASIAERRVTRVQLEDEFQSEVLTDLQTVNQSIAELLQQKIAAEDRLARLEIRAPQAGTIHESKVQTVGGVVGPGETLMLVVPQENRLIVDARVSPMDIDRLTVDQSVILRLASLEARTTPELSAAIATISPDLTVEAQTGLSYYTVRVIVPDDELAKLPLGAKLVPGMPAEAFIQTGDRAVLSYLVHPLTEQMTRVFREE